MRSLNAGLANHAPRTLVAVLTWKGESVTRRCLESLRLSPEWPNDVIVVDNASGTGEGNRLAEEFAVWSITTKRNSGVAGGYNAAVAFAWERGYDHVLLLNNDTRIIDPQTTRALARAMTDGVAAAGPIVKEAQRIWSAGGVLRMALGHAGHRRSASRQEPYDVDWIDGSAMCVSVKAMCAIGGFSHAFFLYWEETDWCARARQGSWRLVVQPRAQIAHERGATVPALQTRRYALRNSLLFVRRNVRGWRALTAGIAWLLVRVPVFAVRVGRSDGLRAAFGGIRDACSWHARDVGQRGWRLAADGPTVCGRLAEHESE